MVRKGSLGVQAELPEPLSVEARPRAWACCSGPPLAGAVCPWALCACFQREMVSKLPNSFQEHGMEGSL